MAIPTWTVGEVLTAADVNDWFVPVAAVKGSDQPVTSSTTLVNDTALYVPVANPATYDVVLKLIYEGAAVGTGDLKFTLVAPSGASLDWTATYSDTAGTVKSGQWEGSSYTVAAGTSGSGIKHMLVAHGTLITTTSGGNLQVQWAQNTSSATATIVHAGSSLTARRIA